MGFAKGHLALVLGLVLVAPIPGSQRPRRDDDRPDPRQRWELLSVEERRAMAERFEAFQRLAPEQREELERRARKLRRLGERERDRVAPPLREELDRLEPDARRELWHDHLRARARDEGRRVRDKLPPELIERLEAAPPEERPRMLDDFRRGQRERGEMHALKQLGKELGLSREDLERIKSMPREQRQGELLALHRRLVEATVARLGRPDGLDDGSWQAMRRLPDEEFLQRWHALGAPEAWRPGRRGGDRPRPGGEPPGGDPRLGELHRRMRPSLEERIELARLPREERKQRVVALVRERVLAHLADSGLASEEELSALRAVSGDEFLRAVQRFARSKGAERPDRDRPPEGRGERDGRRPPRDGPPPEDRPGSRGGPRGGGDRPDPGDRPPPGGRRPF